jgi:hypothetical protein
MITKGSRGLHLNPMSLSNNDVKNDIQNAAYFEEARKINRTSSIFFFLCALY